MSRKVILFVLALPIIFSACKAAVPTVNNAGGPTALAQVPAVRLNFRYEADVPGPGDQQAPGKEERNAGVQSDFDQNRPQEVLDKTLSSPDQRRVVAIYHRVMDVNSEYRMDMYLPDGKLLHKVTPDTMAVHFPDTILWSPDSSSVAFVATTRTGQTGENEAPTPPPVGPVNPEGDSNSNSTATPPPATPTPTPQAAV